MNPYAHDRSPKNQRTHRNSAVKSKRNLVGAWFVILTGCGVSQVKVQDAKVFDNAVTNESVSPSITSLFCVSPEKMKSTWKGTRAMFAPAYISAYWTLTYRGNLSEKGVLFSCPIFYAIKVDVEVVGGGPEKKKKSDLNRRWTMGGYNFECYA